MKEKKRSKKERKGGASYTKQNQKMLEPKKIRKRRGKRKTRKVLEPKKLENRGMRGDQTKKCWSQKKKRNGGVRGDQTKKCWSQKKSRREKGGRKPRKVLEPKKRGNGA